METIVTIGLGVLATLIATVALRRPMVRMAWRFGMVDRPKLRGVHADAVPRSGGLLVLTAAALGMTVELLLSRAFGVDGVLPRGSLGVLFPLSALILTGILDDIRELGALPKLCVQIGAGVWAYGLGFDVSALAAFGSAHWELGFLSLPFTVIFVVSVINAVNMIDGVDGLCAMLTLVALGGLVVLFGADASLALPVVAGVGVFFFFNVSKKRRMFLGDSGSMALGFLLAVLMLRFVRVDGAANVPAMFLLLSLPLADITLVFARRIMQGLSPMHADRGHTHHIVHAATGGRTLRVLTVLGVASVAGIAATMLPTVGMGVACALIAAYWLGLHLYAGFLHPVRLLTGGRASDLVAGVRDLSDESGAYVALKSDDAERLLRLFDIDRLVLNDDLGREVLALGEEQPNRRVQETPLFAAGRVERGRLILEGRNRGAMIFAAQALLPLYPALLDLIALNDVRRRTTRLTRRLVK